MAAIYRTGPAFACHKVMTVCGFDFVAADVAADCISDDHRFFSLKSSLIKCAPNMIIEQVPQSQAYSAS